MALLLLQLTQLSLSISSRGRLPSYASSHEADFSDSRSNIESLSHRDSRDSRDLRLLTEQLAIEMSRRLGLSFEWLHDHRGNESNELADTLAKTAASLASFLLPFFFVKLRLGKGSSALGARNGKCRRRGIGKGGSSQLLHLLDL